MSFLVSIVEAISNHVPFKYKCIIKRSNQNRHVYLTPTYLRVGFDSGEEVHHLVKNFNPTPCYMRQTFGMVDKMENIC